MDSMKIMKKKLENQRKARQNQRKSMKINEYQWEMKGNQWEINEKQKFSIDFRIFFIFFMESVKKQLFP